MDNIVISKYGKDCYNAGPKAKVDIENILKQRFKFKSKCFNEPNKFGKIKYKLMVLKQIIYVKTHKFNICFFQLPFSKNVIKRTKAKIKIGIVHDINGLRYQKNDVLANELESIKMLDYIIVHNSRMKEYLCNLGVKEEKLIILGIFDYLSNMSEDKKSNGRVDNLQIVYAGNLLREKSPFLYQLDDNKMNFSINLYGKGIEKSISENLIYKGAFKPDKLNLIEGNIGLVWDGNFDESDEKISFKNYTKYNNPHKISCYIAAGLPVIVWSKSAVADFVEDNNIGYIINNIYDINSLDFSDYDVKKQNLDVISQKVKEGFFISQAVNKILKDDAKNLMNDN